MKVTIIQSPLHWQDRKKNLAHFDTLLASMTEQTDLVVLPEMFATGFTMEPETFAEAANGPTLAWMKEKAIEKNAVVTGSVAVEENGRYFNRLFWVDPAGPVMTYDKRHLFRMAKEDAHYTPGHAKIITRISDWNICPMICYDLRFPAWSRNRFKKLSATECEAEYDVLIYVANWPAIRSYPWKQLLVARAIENQCYVIGVNRVGKDGNGYDHTGDSVVLNPKGETISQIQPNEECVATIFLERSSLVEFRKQFPVGLDADEFEIK